MARSAAAPNLTGPALAAALPGEQWEVREEIPFSSSLWWSALRIRDEFVKERIAGGPRLLVHDEGVIAAERKRQEEAESIVERCITDYKLETAHGLIPLKVEGKTAGHWSK